MSLWHIERIASIGNTLNELGKHTIPEKCLKTTLQKEFGRLKF